MRFKGTIFLTFLLILLGFYLYLVELPREQKEREIRFKEGKLYNFQLHEISRVTLNSPKGEVEFEYFPEHPKTPWRIFHPVETIANQSAANELGTRLMNLSFNRIVEAKPKELKDFGLDPPQYRVLITLNQTNTEILEIGDENLTGTDVYVRLGEGTSLYLVPAGIKQLLDKDLTAWRQTEIFPFASEDILEMTLSSDRGHLKFIRQAENWIMESRPSEKEGGLPLKVRGDRGEIANLLGSIVNFRGDNFIDFKKNQWKKNFGPPLLKLILKVSKLEKEGIFYKDGANPELVYVVTNDFDPIFQITDSDLSIMDQAFENYRDRHLVPLEYPNQIETVQIDKKQGAYVLSKKEGEWRLEKDGTSQKVTTENEVSRLLTNLYHMQLDVFQDELNPDALETGLNPPQLSIHLRDKNGETLGRIDLGRQKNASVFGKSTAQPYPFLIPSSTLEQIPDAERFLGKGAPQKPAS